ERKLDAVHELESQVYEGGALGSEESVRLIPPADRPEARKTWLRERWQRRQADVANTYRDALIRCHGEDAGKKVKYAEAFELCEYGRRPGAEELKKMFPLEEKAE